MRVTSKGQVTIPQRIRRKTGIQPGTEVDFAERNGQVIIMKSPGRGAKRSEEFADYLDRVTGIIDLGMDTDEFMELLRGE